MTRQIHTDQGYDHDKKYSKWRREVFPAKAKRTDAYCTDVDWIEWRNGKPVAILECRRAIGSLKTAEEAIEHFKKLTNGFQFEVLARLAHDMGIGAYIIGMQDSSPDSTDYSNARFIVEKVIPPAEWGSGRMLLSRIKTERYPEMNEQSYISFISELG